jgi:hypothetical protein
MGRSTTLGPGNEVMANEFILARLQGIAHGRASLRRTNVGSIKRHRATGGSGAFNQVIHLFLLSTSAKNCQWREPQLSHTLLNGQGCASQAQSIQSNWAR